MIFFLTFLLSSMIHNKFLFISKIQEKKATQFRYFGSFVVSVCVFCFFVRECKRERKRNLFVFVNLEWRSFPLVILYNNNIRSTETNKQTVARDCGGAEQLIVGFRGPSSYVHVLCVQYFDWCVRDCLAEKLVSCRTASNNTKHCAVGWGAKMTSIATRLSSTLTVAFGLWWQLTSTFV